MNTQPESPLVPGPSAEKREEAVSVDPKWWTEKHHTSWERVKDAFRRYWEPPHTGAPLGTVLDGHPQDVVWTQQKLGEVVLTADGKIAKAQDGIADATAKLDETLVAEKSQLLDALGKGNEKLGQLHARSEERLADGRGTVSEERERLSQKVDSVHQRLEAEEQESRERLADARTSCAEQIDKKKQHIVEATQQRDEAVSRWRAVEREARYGFAARTQYAATANWDETLENQLHSEWDGLGTGRAWEESKHAVRRGWDFGAESLAAASKAVGDSPVPPEHERARTEWPKPDGTGKVVS